MSETAKRAFVASIVVVAVVVTTLALWKLKLIISLLFLGVVLSAAMRPGVEWLARRRVPRAAGIAIHYVGLLAFVGLLLWLAVPRALSQVQAALGVKGIPTSAADLETAKQHSTGIKHQALVWLQGRLQDLPSAGQALTMGTIAMEVVIAIFFTLAVGGVLDLRARPRDRRRGAAGRAAEAQDAPRHLAPDRPEARRLRARPGPADRGGRARALAVVLGGRRPVLDPDRDVRGTRGDRPRGRPDRRRRARGRRRLHGLGADGGASRPSIVLAVRMLEDYVVIPRVLGHAVSLSPLVVLFSITSVTILLGGISDPARRPTRRSARDGRRRARVRQGPGQGGRTDRPLHGARRVVAQPWSLRLVRPCASGRRPGRRA